MRNFKELRTQLDEKYKSKFPASLIAAAVKIALDMGGNMTGAYKKIENMKRGLGDDPIVKDALRAANEEVTKEGALREFKTSMPFFDLKKAAKAEKLAQKMGIFKDSEAKGKMFTVYVDGSFSKIEKWLEQI